MSNLFTICARSASVVLALACIAHVAGTEASAWLHLPLIFSLPVLWMLWIGCVLMAAGHQALWRLVFLWLLIDVAALAVMTVLEDALAGTTAPRGDDVAFVFAFSPVILPSLVVALWSKTVAAGVAALAKGSEFIPAARATKMYFSDWIGLSIASAIPSFLFVWRVRARRLSGRWLPQWPV